MVLINGKSEQYLNITDRGLQYGDGLFETVHVNQGQPVFLHEHLHRLKQGCERLLIPCPALDVLSKEAIQLASPSTQAVLKIIVTRGSGGRGYRQPDCIMPTRILSLHPYPDYPAHFKQLGVVARFCQTRLGLNPSLAGIKHLNRLEQVLARAEWQDAGIQEGLMLDALDRVIEGTMSNLFYIKNQTLITAPLTFSGVAGIMRAQILRLATLHDLPVKQVYFSQEALLAADELFLTNSIIGIWPVKQLEQQVFPVGEATQKMMASLEQST
ncbi:MAG: aminodeoxychorismate lyase [Methylococcaceae bacterium]|nr:aminodeoxychorismate lyase [Methylococcaceae bacterium]